MKKRIVYHPVLGIDPETNSGGGVYDREVIKALVKNNIEIDALLPKRRNFPQIKGLKVSYAPIKHMVPSYIFNIFSLIFFFSRYQKNKPFIIRVHNPYFVGPAAVIFKLYHPDVKLIASYLHLEDGNWRFSLIDRLIISRFDWIITVSEFSKKELISKYKNIDKKLSVAYPGVGKEFRPTKKSFKLVIHYKLQNKFVCLYLGGLKKRKNPLFLLEIAKKINDPDVVFMICGSGSEEKTLKGEIKKLNLKNVILTGFISEKKKVDFYNLADIFVLPSLKEGFGMIAAEAQACGKPAIVSDRGSLPETVNDGRSGYVVGLSPSRWAKKILHLKQNPKLVSKMSKEAIAFSKNFEWDKNANEHIKVIKALGQ